MSKIAKMLWNLTETVMKFLAVNVFRLKISEEKWQAFTQFVKFGLVGVSNTLISYVVYMLLVALGVNYLLSSVIGFTVSVANSFHWNNKYVFVEGENENRSKLKAFVKTFLAYAGTGLILSNILLFLWVDTLGIHKALGPLINLFITVPLNFIINKLWAFKKATVSEEV